MAEERYNSGDARSVEARRVEVDFIEKQSDRDFRWQMSDIRGRREMAVLLVTCGLDPTKAETGFTGNSRSFFNQGMQQVGLKYQARALKLCPQLWYQMISENFLEKSETQQALSERP